MLRDTLFDRLFKFGGLEKGLFVRDSGKGFVCLKDLPCHPNVDREASLDIQAKPSQHYCDQAPCSSATNEVEIVAWFRGGVPVRRFPLALDVHSVHEFLKDDEHRVAANASTI